MARGDSRTGGEVGGGGGEQEGSGAHICWTGLDWLRRLLGSDVVEKVEFVIL